MPRAGLNRDVVIAEAARLSDEVGSENLTLAALAARFGVAVPSLYKHVDGLGDLRRGVTLLAIRELGQALEMALAEAAGPGSGTRRPAGDGFGDRIRALATAYRGYAVAHPGRYAATVRAAAPDDAEHAAASDAVVGTVFGVLAGRGFAGDAAIDAARTLRAALHGFVALEAAGGFGLPRDVERSFDALVSVLDRGLAVWEPEAAR